MLPSSTLLQSRYRIAHLLGQGGFGAVYKAWDLNLNRPCAVKENLSISPEAERQFAREATILANLSHPNLPHVTDHFTVPNQGQYLVMEFIDGEDLESLVQRQGTASSTQAVEWVSQIADALAYLHRQTPPIVHRDIKPANIRVTADGRAVLVDFGLVKVFDPHLRTTVGARAITPGFSPPEQYGQGTTEPRSDIYSLGATLYSLLTGQEPQESIQRLTTDIFVGTIQTNPHLTPQLGRVIETATALTPSKRYQSAAEFKRALHSRMSFHVPTWVWIVGGITVMAGACAVALGSGLLLGQTIVPRSTSTNIASAATVIPSATNPLPTATGLTGTLAVTPAVSTPLSATAALTSTPSLIANAPACPPNTTGQIAFASTRDGATGQPREFEIYVMNADGSGVRRLTFNSTYDGSPNWSPDGRRIAFEGYAAGNSDIYTINIDGSNLIQLTNSPADDFVPLWSPDGRRILFYSKRDGNYEIYVMNADGAGQIDLTSHPASDRLPTWSPDGQHIAFSSNRDGNFEIYVMNAGGTGQYRLFGSPAEDRDPAWSPDGTKIAFESERDGNIEIYVMNTDGSGQTNLTQNRADDSTAAWSSDGSRISFESTRDGNVEVYVMNADGSCPTRLTFNSMEDEYSAWSP